MGGHTAPVKISTAVKALELDFVVQFFELLSVREFSYATPDNGFSAGQKFVLCRVNKPPYLTGMKDHLFTVYLWQRKGILQVTVPQITSIINASFISGVRTS